MSAPPILLRPCLDDIKQNLDMATHLENKSVSYIVGYITSTVGKHLDLAYDEGMRRGRKIADKEYYTSQLDQRYANPPDYDDPPVPENIEPQPIEVTGIDPIADPRAIVVGGITPLQETEGRRRRKFYRDVLMVVVGVTLGMIVIVGGWTCTPSSLVI